MRQILLVLALAGCLTGPSDPAAPPDDADSAEPVNHSFRFEDPATVLRGLPGYSVASLGEPVVQVASDGTRFVGMIGCDEGVILGAEQDACRHTPILRSRDGREWELLNQGADRRLDDGPSANGDIDLQWLDGSLHALLLGPGDGGSSAMHHVSHDGGETWSYEGPVGTPGVDRQWLFANRTHVFATFTQDSGLPVHRLDGAHWTPIGSIDPGPNASAGPQGPPVYGAACDCFWAAVHATESTSQGLVGGELPEQTIKIFMMTSRDGGEWSVEHEVVAAEGLTGRAARWQEPVVVDPDGGVWAVWVRPEGPPGAPTGTSLQVVHRDPSGNWSSFQAPAPANVAMPTLASGSPPLLAFLGSSMPGDSGRVGQWSLYASPIDGSQAPVIIDADIHQGGICSEGLNCIIEGGDRALLDYMSAGTLPDGRYVVAYTADPVAQGKETEVRYIEESLAANGK